MSQCWAALASTVTGAGGRERFVVVGCQAKEKHIWLLVKTVLCCRVPGRPGAHCGAPVLTGAQPECGAPHVAPAPVRPRPAGPAGTCGARQGQPLPLHDLPHSGPARALQGRRKLSPGWPTNVHNSDGAISVVHENVEICARHL